MSLKRCLTVKTCEEFLGCGDTLYDIKMRHSAQEFEVVFSPRVISQEKNQRSKLCKTPHNKYDTNKYLPRTQHVISSSGFSVIYCTTNSESLKIREWVCSVTLRLKLHKKNDMNDTKMTYDTCILQIQQEDQIS